MKLYKKSFTRLFIISTLAFNLQASNSLEQRSPAKIKKSVSFSDVTTTIEIAQTSSETSLNGIIRNSTSADDIRANLKRKSEELLTRIALKKMSFSK